MVWPALQDKPYHSLKAELHVTALPAVVLFDASGEVLEPMGAQLAQNVTSKGAAAFLPYFECVERCGLWLWLWLPPSAPAPAPAPSVLLASSLLAFMPIGIGAADRRCMMRAKTSNSRVLRAVRLRRRPPPPALPQR